MNTNMSDEETKNKTTLVSAVNRGLATRSSGLAKRGLELFSSQQERVIHFPTDCSMGKLYLLNLDNPDSEWEVLGEARGIITVPVGKGLELSVSEEAVKDLSPLSKLKPNDLQELSFFFIELKDVEL
ncbi:MAG: hypothetical protein HW396_880, partial [Candidatus Dadabacteria bacterium]|nr:hypothetical protein [Candidatus Dadabacteria bacterium]